MFKPPKRSAFITGAVAIAVLAPVAIVQAQTGRETQIVPGLDAANGPSDNTTFSQDNRKVAYMAFDSAASNLVAGDANGKRDVFLLTRTSGEGNLTGSLSRVSAPGNGDSSKPSIDGDTKRSPHCVTFESTSTNLDKADRSPDSDVYLRDLKSKKTVLVSAGHSGARNGVVDGECAFVTYDAGGKVFVRDLKDRKTSAVGKGTNPDQTTNGKGVAYERGGQIYYQGFQKVFNKGNPKVKKIGRELLVSAGDGKGNGISKNASTDDNGHYVAFESTATNLCTGLCKGVSEDRNGPVSDVFRRTISPKAPTKDKMQMVSFSFAVNEQGNGASNNAAMTGAGENILFDSEATNLRQSPGIRLIDGNGTMRDVFYWNFPRGRQEGNVSRESRPGAGTALGGFFDGASTNPSASNRANYVAFTSTQAGLVGDANGAGVADVFMRFLGGSHEGHDTD